MKPRFLAAVGGLVCLLVVGQAVARLLEFSPGQILRAIDLNAVVQALTGATSGFTPIQVTCPAERITDVLPRALPGSTIQITGTCTELITITTDRLTLDGQGSAILDGGGEFPRSEIGYSEGVITVDGARGVTIMGLTVRNGPDGIHARRGASVTLRNVTARGNADEGIQVTRNSTADIVDCTAEDNGDDGFDVSRASSGVFRGTIVSTGNADDGISIILASSGSFSQARVMANNNGLSATFGSDLFDGFILGDGIHVFSSSELNVSGDSTVEANGNADDGIVVARTSTFAASADADSGPITITAEGNGQLGGSGFGVVVSSTAAFIVSGTTATLNVGNNVGGAMSRSSNALSDFVRATVNPSAPVVPFNLTNRTFSFTDGAAFGLSNQAMTLSFGNFGTLNTASFTLRSGSSTATGTVTVASCTFTVMTSDFAADAGPQVSDVIPINPCEIDPIGRLVMTNETTQAVSNSS